MTYHGQAGRFRILSVPTFTPFALTPGLEAGGFFMGE